VAERTGRLVVGGFNFSNIVIIVAVFGILPMTLADRIDNQFHNGGVIK
jgi:hypothetical protein